MSEYPSLCDLRDYINYLDSPELALESLLRYVHELHGGAEVNVGLCLHEVCVNARKVVGLPS